MAVTGPVESGCLPARCCCLWLSQSPSATGLRTDLETGRLRMISDGLRAWAELEVRGGMALGEDKRLELMLAGLCGTSCTYGLSAQVMPVRQARGRKERA